ncbi:macro domain-containing protein [Paenibacillus odorifer]|uniref:macro domain-containing protein n=1 Tax=Paenibacillus odorifer TaxID=189426 RepID=UPI000BA15AD7|nr:macro domain-containing protein [Paenibacillus odorifer]OZQ64380.1 Appr-1-p processing protein [Paenibacillus odorifer]
MLKYSEGTVFNSPAKTIVNTINCYGVMGAGIAKEFKMRYPEMYKDYVLRCQEKKVSVGHPYLFEYSHNQWILNFPTKNHWKFPSKMDFIESGLRYFVDNYQRRDFQSIAFPKLGTNNGGLEWNKVKELMEYYLSKLDIDVYICTDEKKEAEGIEKLMIDLLNRIDIKDIKKKVKLTDKQMNVLNELLPVSRIRNLDLAKQSGLGKQTYENIFIFLYQSIVNKNDFEEINNNEDTKIKQIKIEQVEMEF